MKRTGILNFRKNLVITVGLVVSLGLVSCVNPKSASEFEGDRRMVSVTLHLGDSGQGSGNQSGRQASLSTLPGDTGTILMVAVDESIAFTNRFSTLSSYYDRSLLDLNSSTVTLNIPLNTPLKLFEYAFGHTYSSAGQLSSSDLVIASASIDFIITDADVGQTKIIQSALSLVASPVSISVSPESAALDIGESVDLTANGEFSDSSVLGITNFVSWSVADSSIVSVTNSETSKGTVTALADGQTTVTATLGSVSGSTTITSGTYSTGPTSVDFSKTTDQATDIYFAVSDFAFQESTSGETFASVQIGSLPSGGTLFLDKNFNSLIDTGESVAAGDEILVTELRHLRYRPLSSGSGTGYDSFTFKVGSENGFGNTANTVTININAVSYSCPSTGSGSSSNSGIFSGSGCTDSGASITVMPGHVVTIDPAGNPISSATVNSGGTLVLDGVSYSGDLILNGGLLDIDDHSEITGDIYHQRPSTIDILGGKNFGYNGSDIQVGSNQISFIGDGEMHGSSTVHLNSADSHLYLSGDGFIEQVWIGNTDLNSGLGIELYGEYELRTLYLSADTTINVVSGSLEIEDGLWVTSGPVNLTVYGTLVLGGIVLQASLDIDGIVIMGEMAQLHVMNDATFGPGSDLFFPGGVIVDPGATLYINDEEVTATVTFPGYSDLQGQIVVEGDESVVFANPPLSPTVFGTQVTDNSSGTVSNIDVDTDLNNLTPLFKSEHFCEEFGALGCTSIQDAVRFSHPSFAWFMETDIQGKTYSLHYLPDVVMNPLGGGTIYGREVVSGTHDWAMGSSFVFLGRYEGTTVNGGTQAVIARAGEFLSIVSWVDAGELNHAWYYTQTPYITGYFLDAGNDLYVHFNQDMDPTSDVSGVTPDYTQWDNIRTFRIGLASVPDGSTLTLPTSSFKSQGTDIAQNGSFTKEHFVTVEGQVVDASSDPISRSDIYSNLDNVMAHTDSGGYFTLATLSTDPSTDYQVYIHAGCDPTGFIKTGLTPAWQQYVIECADGGPSGPTVSSGLYNSTALAMPSVGGINWYYFSPGDVSWDGPSFDPSGDIDIYILQDDPTGLDATDSAVLASNVNSKNWGKLYHGLLNTGFFSFDPSYFYNSGNSYRILLIDGSGNWDISDNDFTINLVNSGNYYPSAITTPNGAENWQFGTTETITWSSADLSADSVNFFLIKDDPSILDTTADITTSVNSLKWNQRSRREFNIGQRVIDPAELGSNGADSRLLIIDSGGNWDISDGDFTINMVVANKYWPFGLTNPNGGEVWNEGSTRYISWDTGYIDSGKLSVYVLNDTSTDMYETDPSLLTGIVNGKLWEHRYGADAEWGSEMIDPSWLKTGAGFLWLLIIDQEGNWDISDGYFQVVP